MDVFLIEDENLLKTYNDTWNKVSNSMRKEIDSALIYNEKFLKTRVKSYGDATTEKEKKNHDKEIPEVVSNCVCLAVILIDFVLKKEKNYYPQAFLKECKHIEKEKKVIRYITDDLNNSSDDSDEE